MTKGTLTKKEEAFCKAYIVEDNASDAYRQAYNAENMKESTINSKACLMMKKGKVRARVKELRERALKRHDVTVDSLVKELEEARALAKKCDAAAPMISATMGKAKLHGLLVDKQELGGVDGGEIKIHDRIEIVHVRPGDVK